MPDRIHLTVATVVHRAGRFLMVRENDNDREVINQPAGHVEPGETLMHAAVRETLEETGWYVKLTGLLGISHYFSPHNGKTYYRVSFVAEPLHLQPDAELDPDIVAVDWLNLEELTSSANLRSPLVLSDTRKYLNKIIYPIEIIGDFEDGVSS